MSVQSGIWHFDSKPVQATDLSSLGRAAGEFGPDGESQYVQESVGMLYQPFHTTTESREESQPFVGSQHVFTWDGRLDNRDDLAGALRNLLPIRPTDVAIVAAAFERWGTDCFGKLIGEWAASIWDPSNKQLLLARDYIGVRQLFYYPQRHQVAWCTILSALAQYGGGLTVCDEYVAGYLAFKPAANLTPYQELRSVPPGGFVSVRNGEYATHAYWRFDPWRKTRFKTNAEYEDQYFCLLRQAVRRRLRSDRPVLAALSGGLDSTSIVCVADHSLLADSSLTPRVDTVSYYDPLEPDEDDFYHVTKAEEKRGRVGFHLSLRSVGDSLSFDDPAFAAHPGFGMRKEVTSAMSDLLRGTDHRVMLSGTGGDEINGQALNPAIPMADRLAHGRWRETGKQLVAWSLLTRKPALHLLIETLLELLPLPIRALCSERGELQPWVNRHFAKRYRIRAQQLEDLAGVWFWRPGPRDSAQTLMTLSRDLTCAAPSRLEQRYPYLDQELVEFSTSIPFDQLLRPGQRRDLMRRSLSHLLPPEVRDRKTKVSASRCYSTTLQKHWQKVEDVLSCPLGSLLGYVEAEGLRSDLVKLKNGIVPPYLVRLLKALSLELWLRDVCSRGIISIPATSPEKVAVSPARSSPDREQKFDPQKKGGEYHVGIREA
jgi:asparagine synthase (glutamine-hydrolysing)